MSRYESRQELASKIDHEGGLESFLHYGFDPCDGPDGDDELEVVATDMIVYWREFQEKAEYFKALLPEPADEY